MKALPATGDLSLIRRLWVYQAERFPLAKTLPLLAVFSAASVTVSSVLADRPLPDVWAYLGAFVLALVIFFQMRVADEFKDYEDDLAYRPERPVQRGLIKLEVLGKLAASAGVVAFGVILTSPVASALALLAVWGWLMAMSREFWAPEWLKARPVVYLVSHMAIMPLIDLLLTSFEWGRAGSAPAGLWTFLALSFVNGCVLEIGRKLWSPESEREGVETYSKLWGPQKAAYIWLAFVAVAFGLLVALGTYAGALIALVLVGGAGLLGCAWLALRYAADPKPKMQAAMDNAAGLWVLVCYGSAGLLPWLLGGSA